MSCSPPLVQGPVSTPRRSDAGEGSRPGSLESGHDPSDPGRVVVEEPEVEILFRINQGMYRTTTVRVRSELH